MVSRLEVNWFHWWRIWPSLDHLIRPFVSTEEWTLRWGIFTVTYKIGWAGETPPI